MPHLYTAKCVDGVTTVDLFNHNSHGKIAKSPFAIKACDKSSVDTVCHLRYILNCNPINCETKHTVKEKRLRGSIREIQPQPHFK